MGFFADLAREDYDRTYTDSELVRRLAIYFKHHGKKLMVTLVATLIVAVAAASSPVLVSYGVGLLDEDPQSSLLYLIALALFVLGVVVWMANWVRRRAITRVIGDVMLDLRKEAFSATASHDMSFYDEHASGKVVSRITSDTNEFAQVSVLITELATQMVQVVILIVVLFQIDVRLTLLVLAMLPILFLASLSLWPRIFDKKRPSITNLEPSISSPIQ
jgi:ATP-binding cassette subfamily B protein